MPGMSQSLARTQQVGQFVARQVPAHVIDLSVGQPSPALLPLRAIQSAAAHRLQSDGDNHLLLQYGPAAGYRGAREALSKLLSQRCYDYPVPPENLMLTAGVSHGVDLAVRHLSSPNACVAVECPTYFLAQRIFDQCQLRTLHVRTDEQGLDVQHLEHLLQGCDADPTTKPSLLYIVPVHSNPRGVTLPQSRRQRLLHLAHHYQFTILADEVYQLLSWPGAPQPPQPLRCLERSMGLLEGGKSSRVVSMSSFSKILAPGLRLGWIEADPAVLQQLKADGALHSGGCMVPLQAGVVHSALELGLAQQHLDEVVKPTLEANCDALCTALDQLLPSCQYTRPQGGYFVWLRLPPGLNATALLAHAEPKHDVRFTPGIMFGPGQDNYVRLCFAFYKSEELVEGVQRLAAALSTFQAGHS